MQQIFASTQVKCGSGLARECGVSVESSVTDTPHSRASPLPHWIFVAGEIVGNSGLFDFDRTLPTIDVALAGAGYRQLRLIHILIDR
ncbi:hypothetical protein DBR46_16315 [Pseudomonas sp. KBW05]|nr:hypothetical protein DBR46_16315 [Pseudomonas sp. KBW05]